MSAIVTFWELDNIIGINNNLRIAFDTIIEQEIPQKWKGPRSKQTLPYACMQARQQQYKQDTTYTCTCNFLGQKIRGQADLNDKFTHENL